MAHRCDQGRRADLEVRALGGWRHRVGPPGHFVPGSGRSERMNEAPCQPHAGLLAAPLVDGLGRVHSDLRISVTDRCNIRCFYCMPAEHVRFKPRSEILTFEEIE